jgi:hypothetical protein
MRRPSSLVCLRAAALGLPILVACGTSNTPPSNEGPDMSGGTGSSAHSPSTRVVGSTSTFTSTFRLADGGLGTSTGTTVVSVTTTLSASSSGSTSGSTASNDMADGGGSDAGDAGSVRMCLVAGTNVVADFEDKKAVDAPPTFNGPWAAFASSGTATAIVGATTEPSPPGPTCNKYSLHGVIGGPIPKTESNGNSGYGEVRGDFNADDQGPTGMKYPLPHDISTYQGVSFDVSPGTGTTKYPITLEMIGEESSPASVGGTAATNQVDQYNHRGFLIKSLSSGWQTITVPFSLLIPHWLPSPGASGCGTSGPCEAPMFNPKNALGMQFATNPDQTANGSFDIMIDNVTLLTDASAALTPPGMTMPTWANGSKTWSCTLPTGSTGIKADGKYLLWAYANWKSTFVKGNAGSSRYVFSPEINGGSVVSEGIGYGMLLAVYFNDQSLLNDLWSFWSSHESNGTHLMNWRWDSTGSNNTGSGSASDADEDAAFALYEAGKRWGGSYASTSASVVSDIWSHDMDQTALLPLGGNQGYSATSAKNPSYFAPGYYRIFATIDTAHATQWNNAAAAVYTAINKLVSNVSSQGLIPAWVNSGFTAASMNNASTDVDYQYDSHRIPWRVGLDYCWNKTTAATSFLDANSGFFNGIVGTNGIGRVMDMYTPSGGTVANTAPNSLSIVGAAGAGALHSATYNGLANQAWQLVLDGLNRATLDANATNGTSGYSYYNATIGLMTALTMSGNFYPM